MKNKESTNYDRHSIDQPTQYRIRIRGQLDDRMSDRLGGMRISYQTQEDGSRRLIHQEKTYVSLNCTDL